MNQESPLAVPERRDLSTNAVASDPYGSSPIVRAQHIGSAVTEGVGSWVERMIRLLGGPPPRGREIAGPIRRSDRQSFTGVCLFDDDKADERGSCAVEKPRTGPSFSTATRSQVNP
jgi:hypothetical protein